MVKKEFNVASMQEILDGKVTDAYFVRTLEVLEQKNLSQPVVMELCVTSLPDDWTWAIFVGLEELMTLISNLGKSIDLYCIDEGTLIRPGDPIGYLIGDYKDICVYETAILGLLSQASGIATRASRCVKAAAGRPVLSFGARRIHPTLAPMVDRSAYVGGCQGFSTIITEDRLSTNASGTMHYSLVLLTGDAVEASKLFDEVVSEKVPRISLLDTLQDEKFEAIRVMDAMGDHLYGFRLDTPTSRRGNFTDLLKEIRWELKLRGYQNLRFIVSGSVDENKIIELNPYCYGYGVGTYISNAPVVDYTLDIVEIAGTPFSKRGRFSGRKRLLSSGSKLSTREIIPWVDNDPRKDNDLIRRKIKKGEIMVASPSASEIREKVFLQLNDLSL